MKKKYTLYMAIRELPDFREGLSDSAIRQVDAGTATEHAPRGFPGEAALYIFTGQARPPTWMTDVAGVFQAVRPIQTQSAAGVIFFNISGRTFALTYGYGWIYLDETKFEQDFGLRVAVNLMDDSKVKNLERANLGIAVRNASQTAFEGNLQDLGFDEALDIVRKIAGSANDDELGSRTTGSRSLTLTVDENLRGVPALASLAKEHFDSLRYQSTEFRVIDFLRPVGRGELAEQLDDQMIQSIIQGHADFEITAPQIMHEDYDYFKIPGAGRTSEFPVINMGIYRDALADTLDDLTIETLKKHKISVHSADQEFPLNKWSVYRCIVGSQDFNGRQYAISEGEWYSVEDAFRRSANSAYNQRRIQADPQLGPLTKRYEGRSRKKIRIEAEEDYLIRTAGVSGYHLMDQKLVSLPGVTRGRGVEICDLLDVEGRRLIHVKKGSSSSSVLSHFFRQGYTSAQMLRSSAEFRERAKAKVAEADQGLADTFERFISDNSIWTVEFRIADSVRAAGDYDIPFFSKLSFKDIAIKGETMGYRFRIGFIDVP